MTEDRESLVDGLRRAAQTGQEFTLSAVQAEMIVALLDIVSHARYDANAATMLANAVLTNLRKETSRRR
jgi:hypothetical protein